jgi:hypothetical protein
MTTYFSLTLQAPAPQSAHATPPLPQDVRVGAVMHWPLASQHPEQVVASHVTQPEACSGLSTRQNVPAPQGPEHTPPQPSESPHALPLQSGVQASQLLPAPGQKLP